MMKGASAAVKAMMLIGGLVVILLLVTSVFGRGIAFGILGIAAESEPSFLQEEMRSFLTVASTAPEEAEFVIPLLVNHRIKIFEQNDVAYVQVKPPKGGVGAFYSDPGKITFFHNYCDIDNTEIEFNSKDHDALIIKREGASDECLLSLDIKYKVN